MRRCPSFSGGFLRNFHMIIGKSVVSTLFDVRRRKSARKAGQELDWLASPSSSLEWVVKSDAASHKIDPKGARRSVNYGCVSNQWTNQKNSPGLQLSRGLIYALHTP